VQQRRHSILANKTKKIVTVKDARDALASVGKKLEKALGGEELNLALKAVRVADKCLAFSEKELDRFLDPKTREASLFNSPVDVSRTFKDAKDVLALFAGILKKTEEAEVDIERRELHRRTVAALEQIAPPLPFVGGSDSSN